MTLQADQSRRKTQAARKAQNRIAVFLIGALLVTGCGMASSESTSGDTIAGTAASGLAPSPASNTGTAASGLAPSPASNTGTAASGLAPSPASNTGTSGPSSTPAQAASRTVSFDDLLGNAANLVGQQVAVIGKVFFLAECAPPGDSRTPCVLEWVPRCPGARGADRFRSARGDRARREKPDCCRAPKAPNHLRLAATGRPRPATASLGSSKPVCSAAETRTSCS